MKYKEEIDLIREMLDKVKDKQEYYRDSIIEYCCLERKETHLPFNIFIDESQSYINHNHPLWLYVVSQENLLVPITICGSPRIVDGRIDDKTYKTICAFILMYGKTLQDIANEKTDSYDFATMLISDMPDIAPDQKEKYENIIKGKLKKSLQKFIVDNLDVLLMQCNGEITINDLKKILIANKKRK